MKRSASQRERTRTQITCGWALILILLGACTITNSEGDGLSASDVGEGFGGSPAATTGTGTTGGSSSPGRGSAAQTSPASLATASATAQEPASDALRVGTTPPYAEITGANIRGRGRRIEFILTFADTLPERISDASTSLGAGYRFRIGDVPYVLTAKADSNGWTLSATKNGKKAESGGILRVEGATLTITVPWSFLSGPRTFTWTGFLAWNQDVPVKSYVVDIVPNYGEAPYPS